MPNRRCIVVLFKETFTISLRTVGQGHSTPIHTKCLPTQTCNMWLAIAATCQPQLAIDNSHDFQLTSLDSQLTISVTRNWRLSQFVIGDKS